MVLKCGAVVVAFRIANHLYFPHFTASALQLSDTLQQRFDFLLYFAQLQDLLKWEDIFSVGRLIFSCLGQELVESFSSSSLADLTGEC